MIYSVFFLFPFYIYSETNCLDTGLLIEVWNKGLIWDKAMGHYWLPLNQVPYSNEVLLARFHFISFYFTMTRVSSPTHFHLWCIVLAICSLSIIFYMTTLRASSISRWVSPQFTQPKRYIPKRIPVIWLTNMSDTVAREWLNTVYPADKRYKDNRVCVCV